MADLDALRALLDQSARDEIEPGAAGRAREALHRIAPEMLAVVEAFRAASDAHQKAVDTSDLLPVLTALTDGRRALHALDAKLEEVTR